MEICIGKVTHFYNRISVAVVELSDEVRIGDTLLFLGRTTEFTQELTSMEVNHQKITHARAGMEVAMRVEQRVRSGDQVYKVQTSDYERLA